MRNKLFQQALDQSTEESRQKMRNYTDMIDMTVDFGDWILKSTYQKTMDSEWKWKWFDSSAQGDERNCKYTTEELFSIFRTTII